MRAALPILLALVALSGCHSQSAPNKVADVYDNRADEIEHQAAQQPNPVAKHIYQSRADAIRDEGKQRKRGLEQAGLNQVPPIPAPSD